MKKVIRLTESELISLIKHVISESDPKVGTGKKPEGSDRRLYTDENPSDTVSVKFKTKQDIVDTLNKESFKSKSHARQSQIINLIHQRLRVALEKAKDPEVKKRLRTAFEYIESKKEESKRKTQDMKEGLHDTSWEHNVKVRIKDILPINSDGQSLQDAIANVKDGLISHSENNVLLYKVGKKYEIGDGFHRIAQKILNGEKYIIADIKTSEE